MFFYRSISKAELDFNEKKTLLAKENLELKNNVDSVQATLNDKLEAIDEREYRNKILDGQFAILTKENERLMKSNAEQLEAFKRKKEALERRIRVLENITTIRYVREAISKETNEEIKRLLEDTLNKIGLIGSGMSINPEPVFTPVLETLESVTAPPVSQENEKKGVILSFDSNSQLAVISLGRKDEIKEGDVCKISRDGQEIGSGEVMSVRYRIAAVFVNEIQNRYTIYNIRECDKAIVVGK